MTGGDLTDPGTGEKLVYEGPKSVSVKDVPDATVEKPTDVLVRITTTNICGSDLHMYEGRTVGDRLEGWTKVLLRPAA